MRSKSSRVNVNDDDAADKPQKRTHPVTPNLVGPDQLAVETEVHVLVAHARVRSRGVWVGGIGGGGGVGIGGGGRVGIGGGRVGIV